MQQPNAPVTGDVPNVPMEIADVVQRDVGTNVLIELCLRDRLDAWSGSYDLLREQFPDDPVLAVVRRVGCPPRVLLQRVGMVVLTTSSFAGARPTLEWEVEP